MKAINNYWDETIYRHPTADSKQNKIYIEDEKTRYHYDNYYHRIAQSYTDYEHYSYTAAAVAASTGGVQSKTGSYLNNVPKFWYMHPAYKHAH